MLKPWYALMPRSPVAALLVVPLALLGLGFLVSDWASAGAAGSQYEGGGVSRVMWEDKLVRTRASRHKYGDKVSC